MGKIHSQLNVQPLNLLTFKNAVITSLQQMFAEDYTKDIDDSWNILMDLIITSMQAELVDDDFIYARERTNFLGPVDEEVDPNIPV